jgi:hypothetical protein
MRAPYQVAVLPYRKTSLNGNMLFSGERLKGTGRVSRAVGKQMSLPWRSPKERLLKKEASLFQRPVLGKL